MGEFEESEMVNAEPERYTAQSAMKQPDRGSNIAFDRSFAEMTSCELSDIVNISRTGGNTLYPLLVEYRRRLQIAENALRDIHWQADPERLRY